MRRTPYLFVALEGARPLAGGLRVALRGTHQVTPGRGASRKITRSTAGGRTTVSLALPDPQVSVAHARLDASDGAWAVHDAGSTNGTWLRGERVDSSRLADGDFILVGQTAILYREIESAGALPGDAEHADLDPLPGLATLDPVVDASLERLRRLAGSPVPIILRGESGTGKELLARAVHTLSGRPGPLVAVNCGAIAETLAESQLFGHVKGAFSGALRDEKGFARAADGGTLFLDEIGDLPVSTQAALLRVLQEGEVTPVGATQPVQVDVRIVCATHRPLDELVESGAFRRDLFARLAGFSHALPPLRTRRADLGTIVASLLRAPTVRDPEGVRFDADAVRALLRYEWPMNIRELRQCLATSTVLADEGRVRLADLPAPVAAAAHAPCDPADTAESDPDSLREELLRHMRQTHGNVTQVARAMGKARQQVQRWVRRFGLDPAAFREDP